MSLSGHVPQRGIGGHAGEIMSPRWFGNISMFCRVSWMQWLGTGSSGLLCSDCCFCDLDGRMDGCFMLRVRKKNYPGYAHCLTICQSQVERQFWVCGVLGFTDPPLTCHSFKTPSGLWQNTQLEASSRSFANQWVKSQWLRPSFILPMGEEKKTTECCQQTSCVLHSKKIKHTQYS